MRLKAMQKGGCLVCGSGLDYFAQNNLLKCEICQNTFISNARCSKGHFVCDSCHQIKGVDFIENFCFHNHSSDPGFLLHEILKSSSIKMHGPEHHFLVPAVLLTACYTQTNRKELIASKLKLARQRAQHVLGGFCGFYGSCGAGVGNGIFLSIFLDNTPLKTEEWKLSNLITAKTLEEIAQKGGPRCCKRDTFIAIEIAVNFIAEHLSIELENRTISCKFSSLNKECKAASCDYYSPVKSD
jgi:hypothetical protein